MKNIRFIGTGQITVGSRHAKQELVAVNILLMEGLLLMLCFNECDLLTIEVNDMKGDQPSWGLCIQFGIVPVIVFLGFGSV